MWIDEDLPTEIAERIQPICKEGDALGSEHAADAIAKFREAYEILPDPKEQWLAATWILTAIGDTAFLAGDMELAGKTFQQIDRFEGWFDNAFIRLRRGQIAFEFGNLDRAANELTCAFMAGGYGIFEIDDEKYAEFVFSKLLPPVPPVRHPLARFHMQPPKPRWKFWG